MLEELMRTKAHPVPVKETTVQDQFRRWGADEWDSLRERFRAPAPGERKAAE
jgi:hypothetical protein